MPPTPGLGKGDRTPRHTRPPRGFPTIHSAGEWPWTPVAAATPPLAALGRDGRHFSPISGFGEVSDRGSARLPQILFRKPLSPTPRWFLGFSGFLETSSLATVARQWDTSLPVGAPRFRGTQARALRPRRGRGKGGGVGAGPRAKWGSRSGATVGSPENLGLLPRR